MVNLISSIDNHLLKKDKSEQRERHYASDVSTCTRKLYYSWLKNTDNEIPVSNPIPAGAIWKMKIGDSLHEMVTSFLEEAGYDIITEIPMREDIGLKHKMSIRVDAMFIDDDGEESGLEIKTSYGRGIVDIKNNGLKQEHLQQVLVYLTLTGLKKWYIVYVGRDNAYRAQFVCKKSEENYIDVYKVYTDDEKNVKPVLTWTYFRTFDEIINKLKVLETSIENKEIPEREYKVAIKNNEIKETFQKDGVKYKSDWQCMYCAWRDTCWAPVLRKLDNRCYVGDALV